MFPTMMYIVRDDFNGDADYCETKLRSKLIVYLSGLPEISFKLKCTCPGERSCEAWKEAGPWVARVRGNSDLCNLTMAII